MPADVAYVYFRSDFKIYDVETRTDRKLKFILASRRFVANRFRCRSGISKRLHSLLFAVMKFDRVCKLPSSLNGSVCDVANGRLERCSLIASESYGLCFLI